MQEVSGSIPLGSTNFPNKIKDVGELDVSRTGKSQFVNRKLSRNHLAKGRSASGLQFAVLA